jgi:hypothetical protein
VVEDWYSNARKKNVSRKSRLSRADRQHHENYKWAVEQLQALKKRPTYVPEPEVKRNKKEIPSAPGLPF